MSEKKPQSASLKMKLSLKKETLRLIDDGQLGLLDEAVGGAIGTCGCSAICTATACMSTGGLIAL